MRSLAARPVAVSPAVPKARRLPKCSCSCAALPVASSRSAAARVGGYCDGRGAVRWNFLWNCDWMTEPGRTAATARPLLAWTPSVCETKRKEEKLSLEERKWRSGGERTSDRRRLIDLNSMHVRLEIEEKPIRNDRHKAVHDQPIFE